MRTALWLIPVLAAAAVSPEAAAQDADARKLSAFEACARIADDEDRHRCLDEALRTTGMVDEQAAEERARANYGRSEAAIERARRQDDAREQALASDEAVRRDPATASAAPARPAPATPTAQPAAQPAAAPGDRARDSLQTSIAAARLIGNHTIQVTTEDAGTWISTERQRFRRRPADGDAFEIIPAALGGYRCRLERSTIFACRRLD